MENKNNKKKIGIAVGVIVVLIAALLIIFNVAKPKASAGAKAVTIEVVDNTGASTDYDVKTDAEFLAQVFDEVDGLTVEGDTTEYGLYITTVNGVTADYNVDGAYWAIYINGDYGMYGADQQPVTDGDSYSLKYEGAQ